MNNLFESATLKLTVWYLLILMVLSLLFSVILFQLASSELRHGLRAPIRGELFGSGMYIEDETARDFRQARYEEGVSHLIANLLVLNGVTLIIGGGLSYLLARRTLQPIKEAMVAQGQFTSDASHELRTPLTVMQSEIEVGLRDKAATKQEYRTLLESNLEEVYRLRELSERLLLLANDHELPLAPTSLDAVAIEAVSRVVKIAQKKRMSVINEVKPVSVMANAEGLADAVTILLDNAIKYCPEKTAVRIESEVKGKSTLLHVHDQGPGIAGEDLPHIFDRFYRADASRSRRHIEGHGLGLSIARRIVEQHGGQLAATSSKQGTTFTITLPDL